MDWKYGTQEQKSTLNAVNMMGWSGSGAAEVISKDIWDGKINVKYEKLAYDENNKVYGYHDAKEGKTITLNSSLLGGGTEESAKLGAVMTHEGVHANGDRIEAHAHLAALEMYSGVTEKFGLEGDGAFSQVMFDAICDNENWKANQGERDYWKLTKTGQLVSDGDGWLKDENGMYINADGTHTWKRQKNTLGAEKQESGLLNIMEGTSGQKYDSFSDEQKLHAQQLMNEAGLSMDSNGNWNNLKGKQLDMNNVMEYSGDKIAAEVFVRYYDSAVDAKYAEEVLNPAVLNDLHNKSLNSVAVDYLYNLYSRKIEGGDKLIPETAADRFKELYDAKVGFYESATGFVDSDKDYYVSGDYNTEYEDKNGVKHYKDFQFKHYGIDFGLKGGSGGNNIYAGLSGRVTDKDWNSNNGNCLQIQYGYTFENSFIGTGIYGEYLHMQESSIYSKGDSVNYDTILGKIGGTGPTGPKSYDDHLHYDIFTNDHAYHSNSTLTVLLGNSDFWGFQVSSNGGYKHTYDPKLYYSNTLNKRLKVKK